MNFSLTLIDVWLVMKCDNHGEGGIFALLSLIPPMEKKYLQSFYIAVAIIGSSLVIGDGVITPAISKFLSILFVSFL